MGLDCYYFYGNLVANIASVSEKMSRKIKYHDNELQQTTKHNSIIKYKQDNSVTTELTDFQKTDTLGLNPETLSNAYSST